MKPLRNSIHKFLKSAEVTFFEGLYRDYFTRTLFFAHIFPIRKKPAKLLRKRSLHYGKKELKSVRTSAYKLLF